MEAVLLYYLLRSILAKEADNQKDWEYRGKIKQAIIANLSFEAFTNKSYLEFLSRRWTHTHRGRDNYIVKGD